MIYNRNIIVDFELMPLVLMVFIYLFEVSDTIKRCIHFLYMNTNEVIATYFECVRFTNKAYTNEMIYVL